MSSTQNPTSIESTQQPSRCTICIKGIYKKTLASLAPCQHRFHLRCITRWTKDNRTCPNCRTVIKTVQYKAISNGVEINKELTIDDDNDSDDSDWDDFDAVLLRVLEDASRATALLQRGDREIDLLLAFGHASDEMSDAETEIAYEDAIADFNDMDAETEIDEDESAAMSSDSESDEDDVIEILTPEKGDVADPIILDDEEEVTVVATVNVSLIKRTTLLQ